MRGFGGFGGLGGVVGAVGGGAVVVVVVLGTLGGCDAGVEEAAVAAAWPDEQPASSDATNTAMSSGWQRRLKDKAMYNRPKEGRER
jgi:hypothetical protein